MIKPKITIRRVLKDSEEFKLLESAGWLIHKVGKRGIEMVSRRDAEKLGTFRLNKALGWF